MTAKRAPGRRAWIPEALIVGGIYLFVGRVFALPADHVRAWRLAAWAVSGVARDISAEHPLYSSSGEAAWRGRGRRSGHSRSGRGDDPFVVVRPAWPSRSWPGRRSPRFLRIWSLAAGRCSPAPAVVWIDLTPQRSHILAMPRTKLLLAFLLLVYLATRLVHPRAALLCQDAYIFHYAQRWAEGLGPSTTWARKRGVSRPRCGRATSLAAFLHVPIEAAARWTLVLCDLATLALGWRLLARHSLLAATGFGLFFALWPRFAQMPASGLESSLVLALFLAAATFARRRGGGLLHGLLALSRPEGAAMSVLLATRLSVRQRDRICGRRAQTASRCGSTAGCLRRDRKPRSTACG